MHLLKKVGFIILFFSAVKNSQAQSTTNNTITTVIGSANTTQLALYEYYNHTTSEWLKLFRIKDFDSGLGYWGKGGASGRLYFVDYQGEGGSFIDFSFPQSISSSQLPVITLTGTSANDIEWYAFKSSDGPGQNYYDVYIKTPNYHLGLSFLVRGSDYIPYFAKADQPTTPPAWNYNLYPQSFNYFNGNGNFGLGTLKPTERLSVNGNIRAKEIKVEAANWPDYVFENHYTPIPLSDLELYIKSNKHLPGIPAAAEIHKDGIQLGEMNKQLLKKIEELTLYMIELKKDNTDLNRRVKQLENNK